MHIVITPFGSRGDVQPLLALGAGLRARGHAVTFGAAPNYRGWIEESGFRFREIGGDFEPWLKRQDTGTPFSLLAGLARYVRKEVPLCFRQTCDAVRDADLVVTTTHIAAHSAAEAAGVPCRTVLYTAQLLPSRFHPPLAVPGQDLPAWLNRALWWSLARLFDLLFKGPVNRERANLGLAPVPEFLSHARGASPIVASDREFAPIAPDVPPGPAQTGAMTLPVSGTLEPPIEAFLRAGDPPVYIGFGSMPDRTPEKTMRMVLDAVRASGRRAIVCAGWAGPDGTDIPPEILAIREAPHALLFPRVAAAVHHGGAGTTAAAARAGVPQVVVPHLGDQFFHGRRVRDLGIGPAPIPRSRLNASRLASAIREALTTPRIQERARSLAENLRKVDGVGAAVEVLLAGTRGEERT